MASISSTASGMPYGVSLFKVSSKQDVHSEWETRHYLCSAATTCRSAEQWLNRIRRHWICESQHWRKDATLNEDHTRTRNAKIMGNLIQLRNLVLHYYHHHGEAHAEWLPIWVEQNQADIRNAFTLVTENRG